MPRHIQVNGGVFTNGGTNMVNDGNGTAFQYNGSDGSFIEYTTSMDDPHNVRVFNGNGGSVQASTFTDGRGHIITQCRTNRNNKSAPQNVQTSNAIFGQPEMQRAFEEGIQERQRAARDQQRGARDHQSAARDTQYAARDTHQSAARDLQHAVRDRQHAARDRQHAARGRQRATRDHQPAARDEQSTEDAWNSWPLNQGSRPPSWMTGGDPATLWQGRNGPSPLAPSTGAAATGDVWEQDSMSESESDDSDDDLDFRGRRGLRGREAKKDKMRRKMDKMGAKAARLEARVGPAPHRDGCAPPAEHANHAAYAVRSDGNPPSSASTAHIHTHAQAQSPAATAHSSSATQANSGTSSTATKKKKVPRSMIEKLRSMGPSILEGFRFGES